MSLSAVTVALAAAAIGLAAWRAWSAWRDHRVRQAWTDPGLDPGAAHGTEARQQALSALIAASELAPTVRLARCLELCEVDAMVSWRGGLRQAEALCAGLGPGVDDQALHAELVLRLGRTREANDRVLALPADHWRANVVRAGLYRIAGDRVRAESAWVAAAQLGPRERRPALYAWVADSRRQRRALLPPHVSRWERPPDVP